MDWRARESVERRSLRPDGRTGTARLDHDSPADTADNLPGPSGGALRGTLRGGTRSGSSGIAEKKLVHDDEHHAAGGAGMDHDLMLIVADQGDMGIGQGRQCDPEIGHQDSQVAGLRPAVGVTPQTVAGLWVGNGVEGQCHVQQ